VGIEYATPPEALAAKTMSNDLESEFNQGVTRLLRAGCLLPGDLCLYLTIGVQRIEMDGHFYQPASHGPIALVVPVYTGPTPSFMTPADEWTELIDLVAFSISDPHRWWRRTGLANFLGEHLIPSSVTWKRPLQVFATPLDWIKGYGQGVCPLTEEVLALRDAPRLLFDDVDFASQVERQLSRPFPIPRILVKAIAA
jgi:hypothetical protein